MANHLVMQMFYGRQYFFHIMSSSLFTKSFTLYNFFKQFSTLCQFHDYMYISIINITLMKLNNIWMVNFPQNFKFFLQWFDIIFYILSQYTFYSIFNLRIRDSMGESHCPKVTTSQRFNEFIHSSDIKIGKLIF